MTHIQWVTGKAGSIHQAGHRVVVRRLLSKAKQMDFLNAFVGIFSYPI